MYKSYNVPCEKCLETSKTLSLLTHRSQNVNVVLEKHLIFCKHKHVTTTCLCTFLLQSSCVFRRVIMSEITYNAFNPVNPLVRY